MSHEWHDLTVSAEDLPGIGRRYDVAGQDGGRLSVLIHRASGDREVYAYGPGASDDDAPAAVVRLSDAQSRTVGSILGGAFFKTAAVEELETVLSQLTIDWVAVPDGSPLAGNPIGSAEVRRRTGVTILAIVRGHRVLTGPTREDVVEAGDRIVVAGRRDGVNQLHRMLAPPGAG
jgi:TrkA domain protein